MLRDLLRLVVQGAAASPAELARRLGVGVPLVEGMIERLVALAYLERMGGKAAESCADGPDAGRAACAGCPQAGGCGGCGVPGARPTVWTVTERGRAMIRSESAVP